MVPLIDDTVDPIGSQAADAASPVWGKAWQRAAHKRLPRPTRVFAWRLLHGALRCGGSTVAFFPPGDPTLQGARCQNPSCTAGPLRPLETLEHLFLECAPAQQALQWLCALWALLAPDHPPPPLAANIFLADDSSVWAPPPELTGLWGLLRLTMLQRIWWARSAHREGVVPSAAALVHGFVAEVRALIRQDWLRVEGDVRQLGGVCPSWFRGRDPALPLPRFQAWWCVHDVLASVMPPLDGGPPRLLLKLSRLSVPNMAF